MMICYILDGILFVYAIILTVLYCRLKLVPASGTTGFPKKQENDEAVYTGLTPHAASTYETIHVQKKGKF